MFDHRLRDDASGSNDLAQVRDALRRAGLAWTGDAGTAPLAPGLAIRRATSATATLSCCARP